MPKEPAFAFLPPIKKTHSNRVLLTASGVENTDTVLKG